MQEPPHWSGQDENGQQNQAGESEFSSRQSTFSRPVWLSQASAHHSTAAGSAMDEGIFSSPFRQQSSGKRRWPPFALPVLSPNAQPTPVALQHAPNTRTSIFHAPITSYRTPKTMRQGSTHGSNPCLPAMGQPLPAWDTSAVEMPAARQASACASAPVHSEGAAMATDEEGPSQSAVLQQLDGLPGHGHERCTHPVHPKRPRPLSLHGDDTDDFTLLQACPSQLLIPTDSVIQNCLLCHYTHQASCCLLSPPLQRCLNAPTDSPTVALLELK